MDRQTLSHYGWIVVWILTISVMLLFATPFGEYVRTAVSNYMVAFGETLKNKTDDIEDNKIQNDIELNGSFIITDKQGDNVCLVFGVNGSYDGYALESSGTTPNIDDRYFRCTRYVNIEERRSVKEMFHLATQLGYNDTVEGRQGIQCALLHFVDGKDYSDYASSISSTAKDVYDDLLARSGSLYPYEYDYVELIAIEKDGYIDMIIQKKDTYVFDDVSGLGQFVVMILEGKQAYCVETNKPHPITGTVYTDSDYFVEDIERVLCAAYEYYEDSDDFRGASQLAVWAYIDDADYTPMLNRYLGTENATRIYNGILELSETIDISEYNITLNYYEDPNDPDGVQKVVVPIISKHS